MHLGAVATVGLEGTLGHRTVLMRESLPYGQVLSIADPVQTRQSLTSHTASLRCCVLLVRFNVMQPTPTRATLRCSARRRPRRESSSSRVSLLRMHRISVVNSPQSLSVFAVTSRVFTSSGATEHFADKAVHSMVPSVLVSAPFTTEFSGVMPDSGLIERQRTDSRRGAIPVEEPKQLTAGYVLAPIASPVCGEALLLLLLRCSPSTRALCVS